MSELTYDTIIDRLIEEIPEFSEPWRAELEWLGAGDWAYLLFGLVVNPFLVDSLHDSQHEEAVRRIFDFVERMALSDDERLRTVASTSVCERLGGSDLLQLAYPYMGPATRQLSDASEAGWNPSKHGGDVTPQ
jgi:hypothetical protein